MPLWSHFPILAVENDFCHCTEKLSHNFTEHPADRNVKKWHTWLFLNEKGEFLNPFKPNFKQHWKILPAGSFPFSASSLFTSYDCFWIKICEFLNPFKPYIKQNWELKLSTDWFPLSVSSFLKSSFGISVKDSKCCTPKKKMHFKPKLKHN